MPQEKNLINGHVYTEGALGRNLAGDFGNIQSFQAQIHKKKNRWLKKKSFFPFHKNMFLVLENVLEVTRTDFDDTFEERYAKKNPNVGGRYAKKNPNVCFVI